MGDLGTGDKIKEGLLTYTKECGKLQEHNGGSHDTFKYAHHKRTHPDRNIQTWHIQPSTNKWGPKLAHLDKIYVSTCNLQR